MRGGGGGGGVGVRGGGEMGIGCGGVVAEIQTTAIIPTFLPTTKIKNNFPVKQKSWWVFFQNV